MKTQVSDKGFETLLLVTFGVAVVGGFFAVFGARLYATFIEGSVTHAPTDVEADRDADVDADGAGDGAGARDASTDSGRG